MADLKISAATAASAATATQELPINEAGTSKKLTVAQVKAFVLASPTITGTLTATGASKIYDLNLLGTSEVVGLGDSLSNGTYQDDLETLLGPKWNVTEQGVSGATTLEMFQRINLSLPTNPSTAYLIVLGGVNDVAVDESAVNIEANLQDIYDAAAVYGATVVAVTLTPWKTNVDWTAGRQVVTDAVNTWILAQPANVDYVVDAYTALEDVADTLDAAYDSGDGIHLSAAGYAALAQAIHDAVTWTHAATGAATLSVIGDMVIGPHSTFDSVTLTGDLVLPAEDPGETPTILCGTHPILRAPTPALGAGGQAQGLNLFIGRDAGNETLTNGAGATTLASRNIGIGGRTLEDLTTGYSNAAVGDTSMQAASTGFYNAALGASTLYGLTTGYNNSAVGFAAGASITTGLRNVMLGAYAGFDGAQKVDADNTIAIGFEAITTTDNTAVIGNGNLTDVYFGSMAATGNLHGAKLYTTGAAQLNGITTADGFVLTLLAGLGNGFIMGNNADVTVAGSRRAFLKNTGNDCDLLLYNSGGGVSALLSGSERYVYVEPVTYANRPATPAAGMMVNISDSNTATWGATIAGSGANHVLARYNGANWTVVGA